MYETTFTINKPDVLSAEYKDMIEGIALKHGMKIEEIHPTAYEIIIKAQSLTASGDEAFRIQVDNFMAEIVMSLYNEGEEGAGESQSSYDVNKIFIVHGHDEEFKQSVARNVEKLGLKAIILHEQPSQGKTIIEKLESYSGVGFAIVLLSPDDIGREKGKSDWLLFNTKLKPRARQNVIVELGYFIGKLGRQRVCILKREEVEEPSDFNGIVYVPYDTPGNWRFRLVQELRAAGYDVDAKMIN